MSMYLNGLNKRPRLCAEVVCVWEGILSNYFDVVACIMISCSHSTVIIVHYKTNNLFMTTSRITQLAILDNSHHYTYGSVLSFINKYDYIEMRTAKYWHYALVFPIYGRFLIIVNHHFFVGINCKPKVKGDLTVIMTIK